MIEINMKIEKLLLLRSFVNKHFRPSTFLSKFDVIGSHRHLDIAW